MKKEIRVEGLLLDFKSLETLSAREMMQCNALSHMIKVHMKRFFTVVFHFIIVKMNIKESYIT